MKLILLIGFSVFVSQISYAAKPDKTIELMCSNKTSLADQSEVSQLIDKLLTNYKSQEQRVKNRSQFVAALDQIISKTEFAYLLDCRNNLNKSKNFSYELVFQDLGRGNDSMSTNSFYLSRSDGSLFTNVQLEFNLVKAANSVLFVYMHELKHVCQAVEAAKLRAQVLKQSNENTIGDEIRFGYFQEVEAFYTMQLAYRSLVQKNKKLCGYNSWEHPPDLSAFYEMYVKSEISLAKGAFAQPIIYGYSLEIPSDNRFIFDTNSPLHEYNDPEYGKFLLRRIHPKLKELLGRLPISIVEF